MSNGATITLPTIDVTLNVQHFRDAIQGPLCGGSLTEHDVMPRHPPFAHHLKAVSSLRHVIHVAYPGAILRFHVTGAGGPYWPVGLAFVRVNVPNPTAVLWGVGPQTIPGSPFTAIWFVDGILDVRDVITAPSSDPLTAKLFKFSLIIQRLSDGAIGIIDPYIENVN